MVLPVAEQAILTAEQSLSGSKHLELYEKEILNNIDFLKKDINIQHAFFGKSLAQVLLCHTKDLEVTPL